MGTGEFMTEETVEQEFKEPEVVKAIQKKFGEGSIMLIDDAPHMDVETIPTGSLALDLAIGPGGIPLGRITEIYGPEGSGKTTLSQHLVANAQKLGMHCAYIDMEHALDLDYVRRTGVDTSILYISQPDTGEQALEILEYLVRSGEFGLVIVDSVAALVPTKETEGDMGDSHMGLQARLMSQAMRKLAGVIKKSNTAVVFTNQIRMKIGVIYGNPETTPGGKALRFYSSVRIDLRRRESLKQGSEIIGNRIRARVVKNKVGAPFKEAEFEIMYNEGISKEADFVEIGEALGILERRGSYYYYGEEMLGQGKENAKEFLRSPDMQERIQADIYEALQ
jgi:recombination protein RecA